MKRRFAEGSTGGEGEEETNRVFLYGWKLMQQQPQVIPFLRPPPLSSLATEKGGGGEKNSSSSSSPGRSWERSEKELD